MPLPRVFIDFTVGDAPLGRVVFELFSDVVPRTAENFRALCTGEVQSATPLSYKGSPVHRVIEGFMIQGGDFTKRNGTGGESIYGGMFKDERLEGEGTEVDREGLLVMANRGPNTNGSQWFITLAAAPHLTGKHVVFGQVLQGMEHIRTIGALATDGKDRPLSPVIVAHCGELQMRRAPRPPTPESEEDSEDEREREKRIRRRERRERKEREKEERRARRKERRERDRSRSASPRRRSRSLSETLSELDIRLEREEKERLEAERQEQLLKIKADLEAERQAVKDAGGVVYKGRGTMRYRDPESRPANFSSRRPDGRWRDDRGGGDRWERGGNQDRWGRGDRDRDARDRGDRISRGGRDFDRWEHDGGRRRAPEFAAASGESGAAGTGSLAARLDAAPSARDEMPYDDEQRQIDVAREKERDGGEDGRSARAGAWAQARKASPPRRESPDRARERSAESDMALDYGSE